MAKSKENICTVRGSINHDEYFHVNHIVKPGETISSHGHESRIGGKGANQAVAIARAGGRVKFYGTVGSDGMWIKEKMGGHGIDVEGILVADEPTGRAIIQVDDQGENSIILFPGANFSEETERTFATRGEGWFPETTHLLLQNEIHPRSMEYALAHAGKGVCVIMNPSPLPSDAEIRAFSWHAVSWLLVNAAEALGLYMALAGVGTDGADGKGKDEKALEAREVLTLLMALPAMRTTNVVCTLGARGVLACFPRFEGKGKEDGDDPVLAYVPGAKLRGSAQDTTGAGDCFTGYFVQGLMTLGSSDISEEIVNVLKTCVVAAGMCCEKIGTIDSIPMRAEVEERMASSDP
ncbi:Ribokinase-like protein [Pholiota conissans]|uniref:Ribokinase n=1 Tax=Pholiota conissans TaxID=109636 RepID=A0A9P6D030_9AGAR|nr:Ribokinase-like protein [Pholiota conissans]